MSYPLLRTVHAECTGSLRYGRTTLRLPAPPRAPLFDTLCIRLRTQRNLPVPPVVARGMVGTLSAGVPLPRASRSPRLPGRSHTWSDEEVRLWYEDVLGWPTVPGVPVRLAVGVRFDVLDVPAEAGGAALARLERSGWAGCGRSGCPGCAGRLGRIPVALCGGRMRVLVAAGSAEELPGVLEWLEWGAPLELDLMAVGGDGTIEAPLPWAVGSGDSGVSGTDAGAGPAAGRDRLRGSPQGAAVWLRPPEPERGAEASLPTLSAMGTRGARGDCDSPPDLVRLVNTVATQIHRVRLRRAGAAAAEADGQPLAFS